MRFTLPDPVLEAPEQDRTPGMWMSHASARDSVMMQTPKIGAFVRALLPVRLTEGHTLTFGVWLAVPPRQLQTIFAVWWAPEYQALQFAGLLANAVPPWGLIGAPVEAVVRDRDEIPYCDRSEDARLDHVLHDEWPHDVVLKATNQA